MKMVHVLFGAVLTAAVVAGVRSLSGTPVPEPEAAAEASPPAQRPAAPSMPRMANGDQDDGAGDNTPARGGISGQVLEVVEVPNYSYLRVGDKGSDGVWVAVPTAGLAAGAQVRVASPMKMTDFKSTALNRTFPVIYFGTLDKGGGARAAAQGADSPHGADDPHAGMDIGAHGDGSQGSCAAGDEDAVAENPHGGMGDNPHAGMGNNPHSGMSDNPHGASNGAAPADVKPVAKAEGANGRTVAEVIGQRASLSGKTVRIRGTVVKVNAGILGKTFLHLRDGSGDAAAATNDLLVTTESTPKVGDTIVVEGPVILDKDIGAGYRFSTMVEDAKLLTN